MAVSPIEAGQTYHLEKPNPGKPHLFIIVLDVSEETGKTIIVPIDSENYDGYATVEIAAGEHTFIKHHSFVSFRYAQVIPAAWIEAQLVNGLGKRMEDISPSKLSEICDRLPNSKATPNGVKEFFQEESWKKMS